MGMVEFESDEAALWWLIDCALSRMGEGWINDQKLRQFLFDAMASDPSVVEDLMSECSVKTLKLCKYSYRLGE